MTRCKGSDWMNHVPVTIEINSLYIIAGLLDLLNPTKEGTFERRRWDHPTLRLATASVVADLLWLSRVSTVDRIPSSSTKMLMLNERWFTESSLLQKSSNRNREHETHDAKRQLASSRMCVSWSICCSWTSSIYTCHVSFACLWLGLTNFTHIGQGRSRQRMMFPLSCLWVSLSLKWWSRWAWPTSVCVLGS